MPSRSQTNAIMVLATCEGTVLKIRQDYALRREPIAEILEVLLWTVSKEVQKAWDVFNDAFTAKEIDRLAERSKKFETEYIPESGDVCVTLSVCLGTLLEPLRYVATPWKKNALERVHWAMMTLNEYFDNPQMQDIAIRREAYAIATRACDAWREEFGG